MRVTFTKPPLPLKRPPDLRRLLLACGVDNFNGAIDCVYRCPCCLGVARSPNPPTLEQYRTRSDTLRVLPTPENDWAFHCYNCGFLGNGLHLLRNSAAGRLGTWESAVAALTEFDVFSGKEPDEDWVERSRAWTELQWTYDKAVATARASIGNEDYCFGEHGVLRTDELRYRFPPIGRLSSTRETLVRVRLIRTIQGLPSYLSVSRHEANIEICRCYFHSPGGMEVIIPRWAKFYDWSQEIAVATDMRAASELQYQIHREDSRAVPVLYVHHCRDALLEEIPTRLIHYLAAPGESGEFALALCHSRAEVRIRKSGEEVGLGQLRHFGDIEDGEVGAIEFVANSVIERTESDVQALAFLDQILAKPWIAPSTREALTSAVAARLRVEFGTAVQLAGVRPRLLPYEAEHATYLCRNGIYLKSSDRARTKFGPASNFSLRIRESYLDGEETLNHRIDLQMGHRRTDFTIPESDFLSGGKLLEQSTKAALREGWGTLPNLSFHGGISLLPLIVRGTQPAPLSKCDAPGSWGFSLGEFQGPDFSLTPRGLKFHSIRSSVPNVVQMLPSTGITGKEGAEREYLRIQANEFASWMSIANTMVRSLVVFLFYTALYWLHRGSRGLYSYLALSSEEYFAAFEKLTGIQSIEVGRAPREHQGVPRLMSSSYWSLEQFKRQGRIVAAIEDQDHRLDSSVICTTYGLIGGRNPRFPDLADFPPPVFLLLSYAVIGQRTLKDAFDRLIDLVDGEDLKNQFRFIWYHGGTPVVPPGLYLNRFLSALSSATIQGRHKISNHQQKGTALFKRSVFEEMHLSGHIFDPYRVAAELRKAHEGWNPLGTYGRERIPVLRIPEQAFEA